MSDEEFNDIDYDPDAFEEETPKKKGGDTKKAADAYDDLGSDGDYGNLDDGDYGDLEGPCATLSPSCPCLLVFRKKNAAMIFYIIYQNILPLKSDKLSLWSLIASALLSPDGSA